METATKQGNQMRAPNESDAKLYQLEAKIVSEHSRNDYLFGLIARKAMQIQSQEFYRLARIQSGIESR
jgi:hypothetical protein